MLFLLPGTRHFSEPNAARAMLEARNFLEISRCFGLLQHLLKLILQGLRKPLQYLDRLNRDFGTQP